MKKLDRLQTKLISPALILVSCQFLCSQSQIPREVVAEIKNTKTATVIVLDQSLMSGFGSLIRDDALDDFDLKIASPKLLDGDPQNRVWAQSIATTDLWIVVDVKGQLIAKGKALPTSAELNQILTQHGVLPAERYIRQFLRLHPGNQEARTELINLLHKKAVELTIKTLNINPETRQREIQAPFTSSGWAGFSVSKPTSEVKMLDSETDLRIWVPIAQELENLFSDTWIAAPLDFRGYLSEAHSNTMRVTYGRHLNKIQDELVKTPSSRLLWQLWARFKNVVPNKVITNFLNELKPLPHELRGGNYLIDPKIIDILLDDARRNGDWIFVRELLWSHFNIEFSLEKTQREKESQSKSRDERAELAFRADSVNIYQRFIEPLIESLVASEQERLVSDVIYRFKSKRGDVQNLDARLTNLAKRLNKPELASAWINQ